MPPRRQPAHHRDGAALAPRQADEVDLIRRIGEGDLRAFEQLYRIYHPRLTRFLTNLVHRPQLVEEALNDALLVVWERPEGFNGTSRVSTWIFAIAYRKALKTLRRWDEPVEDHFAEFRPSADEGPEQTLGDRQVRDILVGAMGELSSDHRTVVDSPTSTTAAIARSPRSWPAPSTR